MGLYIRGQPSKRTEEFSRPSRSRLLIRKKQKDYEEDIYTAHGDLPVWNVLEVVVTYTGSMLGKELGHN